ncbi:MAG: cell surface protein SprA [Candidatus Latescibacteria bacterium]|nr:cell surface protein SprA [Candidatus Latescibacterota bacterium]
MNRYVLFLILFCLNVTVLLPDAVNAQYTNTTWLQKKSDGYISGENYQIEADEDFIDLIKSMSLEELEDSDILPITVGIRPPDTFPKPLTTVTDSLEVKNSRILRKSQIPNIRTEKYYYIPIDDYKTKNIEDNQKKLWSDNKSRINKWASEDGSRKGDALDFALPVGDKFSSFVGGKTSLNIDGSQTITFSGKSEWTEGQIETSASKNSSFPALTMKQEPQFSIRGSIGDRVTVDIKQDETAQSFSNFEENVSIKYQGLDDEIIQHIEAGNTSLNLEGATFAGYRGSHKGLFGIRTEGRLGPLKFTAIASQEKSESNTKSFRGSAEETSTEIKDYQYKTNTYFFLDNIFKDRYATARTSLDQIFYVSADSIAVIEVYVDDSNNNNNLNEGTYAYRGVALAQNMNTSDMVYDTVGYDGYYHKLDPQRDYYVDRSLGFIVFNQRVQDMSTVGVYIETKDGRKFGSLEYNPESETSKIELKLIKAKNQRPSNKDTWDLEWKNVYDLGQRNIDIEGLEIRIYRAATDGANKDTQDGVPFIHILGLDKADEFGNPTPDNKIDLNRSFVNQYRGELIFPLLRPFDSEAPDGVTVELKEKVPEIYDTANQSEKDEVSKYFIGVKTANRQAVISVGGGIAGIMEGTDQVLLNGQPLARGSDYRINYMTGEVTILNEEALSPTADLVIKYEELNAYQQMQKSLMGLRTEYDLWGDSRIGGTFLFNNESTREKRVRLGQEPSRMFLFDTDAQFNFQPGLLTTAVDKLPGVVADEASRVRIEAEVAQSLPNMNTKGAVYVDDFEGSRNSPLNIIRTNWTEASQPDASSTGGFSLERGRLQWYNPWDRIDSKSIWPNKETETRENTVHVLNLAYGKPEGVSNDKAYGGVMSAFYGAGEDFSRARFIEIWARGSKGTLNIDIGSVTEDFYPIEAPNGLLDTEDKPIPGQGQGDGILTREEDTGLDGLFDAQETGTGDDPHGDNWNYNDKNNYSHINGTEGNAGDSDRVGIPDTEDINNNGILDIKNAYYEYEISFEDPFDKYLVKDSVPEGNPSGWRLFRIPLWDNPDAEVGGSGPPDSTLVEFARMWITKTDTTLIQIASIEIVENNWLEEGIFDDEDKNVTDAVGDVVRVTRVNTDENLNYNPPPGVKLEIDPDTKIRRMEQSLVLEFENLSAGNTAFIYRNYEKMDFTDYTSLKMYVHGSDNLPDVTTGGRNVELIFRFGGDKSNYYEYRTPVYKNWVDENYMEIDFETITAVKLARDERLDELDRTLNILQREIQQAAADSLQALADSLQLERDIVSAMADSLRKPYAYQDTIGTKVFTLAGNPSLQNVKILSIGLRNNNEFESITGDVWLDELRMDDLRAMTGTAARFDINTDLAGFISLAGKASTKTSDFHDMNSKKGTGNDTTELSSSIKANMDRFAPKRWNLSLPITASISESEALPRLKSGSDIILNESKKKDFKSWNTDEKLHFTYSKQSDTSMQPGIKRTLLNWATEKVRADFDWGTRASHSPLNGDNESTNKQIKATYDVNPKGRTVKILKWMPKLPGSFGEKMAETELAYTPSVLNYNYTYDDNISSRTNIEGVSDTTETKQASENYNFGYKPFKSIDYTYTQGKKFDHLVGQETSYSETNRISYKPPDIFKFITHNYSYSSSYNETDNPRYSLASQLGSKSIGTNKDFTINGNIAWQNVFEILRTTPKTPEKKPEAEKPEPPNGNKPEAEKPEPEKDQQPGEPFRNKMVKRLTETFNPITVDYSNNDQLQYAGIAERPDFAVRFGRGTIPEPDSITVVSRQNTSSGGYTYGARTEFKLPIDMGVSAKMSYSDNERISSSAQTEDESITYPEITYNWSKVETHIPFVSRYLTNISLNSGYSISNQKSWQDNDPTPKSDKTTKKLSPLISVNTLILKQIQTNFSLTVSSEETYTVTATESFTIEDRVNTSTQIRYRLKSSRGLLFLKSVKLNSDINITLDISTSGNKTRRRIGDEELTLTNKSDSWAVSPKVDYKFSNSFSGGATMDFRNSKDLTNKVHKVREVSIWGKLTF